MNVTPEAATALQHFAVWFGLDAVRVDLTGCGDKAEFLANLCYKMGAAPDTWRNKQLDVLVPWKQPYYTHAGGNTAAHVKTSLIGSSVQVIVAFGNVQLGMWQAIYLCEFDGPRIRHVWVA